MTPVLAQQGLALALGIPIVALGVLAISMLIGHPPAERRVHQLVATAMTSSLILATGLLLYVLVTGQAVVVSLGTPIAVRGYHFDIVFAADLAGSTYLWLDLLLCGLISAFSERYLHQEPGYHRFFVLMLAFAVGVAIIAVAGGLDLLFAGWEIVGLASALLIAFFWERRAPVENGLRAFATYRFTDLGLLLGIVALHQETGAASLESLGSLSASSALLVGGLLVFGAMGKGAIFPFTPWLPRAMEGPTPSSAIFYGALSIHASPFLLLRVHDVLEASPLLAAAVVALGLVTAAHASMVGRVQTDIKSALGYASVAQVGLIWIWIGLGFTHLALAHIVGHAILRTWQLLRSPSLFLERRAIVFALADHPGKTGWFFELVIPAVARRSLYRLALERWYLEAFWSGTIRVLTAPLRVVDRLDRRWAAVFEPAPTTEDAPAALPAEGVEVHGR
ncbi:MAG: proton-conducting membrane transporter [Myxococcales bacterium]|nr:proton-conducting membrane transporter [Myxococcales bacterium]